MKKAFFFILVFFVFSAQAQDRLSFEKVIQADSIKKDYIYNGLKEWVGMNFKSAKNVIEIDDKESGLLIINSVRDYDIKNLQLSCFDGYLHFTVKFQVKDGRFKVNVTNFVHENAPGNKESCNIGLVTTDELYPGKSGFGMKGYNNKIWNDLKAKSKLIADDIIGKIEIIDFSASKPNNTDSW